jgi:hypothetical protein
VWRRQIGGTMLQSRNMGHSGMGETPFTAYTVDSLVRGFLELADGVRLTDYLNDAEVIPLRRATLRALDDGRFVEAGDVEVDRQEVFACEATPAPGATQMRIRTRTIEIQVELGPYIVHGLLHAPSAGDPLLAWNRRKQMVPLTDSSVTFPFAGHQRKVSSPVLIINRGLVGSVERTKYERSKIDDMGIGPVDSRAVDYTGVLLSGVRDQHD